ncbi:hypothetical protein RO3G_14151 [Rhizopus delemar RA 99-880]|uniref:Golgi apparatus membrane protein TVP18 n=1 Tax=Rhizopus delemar (strain RA 99-880 / ATCC MYA-4621 / FGSC 9543 / NRRL 43880) TaxID=246409 RepID=I1CLW0_RHIO9|nr:hypothetical protein RO3G_14151 [Rhizopus delemar RA 99-880]|eukprot:EIE89440.1 hypothetical protein RO3G_14151 [Rhizopus delemar RA 99-880]
MGVFDEIKSKNFSLYGQWLGIVSIILLIALGIVGFMQHVVFSIVGWVIAFILVGIEVPLCLKLCPTSPKLFAVVMFLSNLLNVGPLIATGVSLLLAAICYGIAAFSGQAFASSRMFGGTGVDNVKLNLLRAEAETATTLGDDFANKIKQLEEENIQKGHEITSFKVKNERLETRLKRIEDELILVNLKSQESNKKSEDLEKHVIDLEQELENAEKKNDELKEMNKSIKEELEEFVRQLEVA